MTWKFVLPKIIGYVDVTSNTIDLSHALVATDHLSVQEHTQLSVALSNV